MADRPVVLVWAKRLWRCPEPACPTGSWSEESDEIAARAVLTERARAEIARRVGLGEQSVARAARGFGVGWHAAMTAVWDHGQPRVDHLARLGAPVAIGLDETSFLAATAHPSDAAGDRHRGPGQRPAHRRAACTQRSSGHRLAGGPSRRRGWPGSATCVIDPYQPYATAVACPAARRPLGRRPLPRHPPRQPGPRRGPPPGAAHHPRPPRPQGRPALPDPPAAARRATNASTLPASPGCSAWLDAGDPDGEVAAATWPRSCCARPTVADHVFDARRRCTVFYDHCAASDVPELATARSAPSLAGRPRSCAWHRTGLTNAADRRQQPLDQEHQARSATASATSTTIGSGCCCAAAPHGNIASRINTTPPPTRPACRATKKRTPMRTKRQAAPSAAARKHEPSSAVAVPGAADVSLIDPSSGGIGARAGSHRAQRHN